MKKLVVQFLVSVIFKKKEKGKSGRGIMDGEL